MQNITLQDALLSWKQRHTISDGAFEELLFIQTMIMPLPTVFPTTTMPGSSNFGGSYLPSDPAMDTWPVYDPVSYNEPDDMLSEPYENRARESSWVYLPAAALDRVEATTESTLLHCDDSMPQPSDDLLQPSDASSEKELGSNRNMEVVCVRCHLQKKKVGSASLRHVILC
jgi:hypothetical protein